MNKKVTGIMTARKEELINKIAEQLISRFDLKWEQDDPFMGEETFLASLKWLPEENLEKMSKCNVLDCKDFEEAYQLYGKAGVLRFQPYVVPSPEMCVCSLCIRRNRFMHMFRGYNFQVSGTEDGIYACSNGLYRTDFLMNPRYDEELLQSGLISYMLWWAAFIDAGYCYDNVRKLFHDDVSVLNQFMHHTMKCWRTAHIQSWSDVRKYINVRKDHISTGRKIYSLLHNNGEIAAYFAIGKESIQVETSNGLLTWTLPDFCEGTSYDLEIEEDRWDYEEQVEKLESNHYLEMLTVAALNLQGIKINFHNWYSLDKQLGSVKPIYGKEVILVKSAEGFYNCTPDEY